MIKVTRGDTAAIQVNLFADNVEYTPTEEETVVFTVKKKIGDDEPALIQKEVVGGVLQLEHEDTKDVPCGTYPCDVRLYNTYKTRVYTPIVDEIMICEVVNCDI